MRTSLLLLALLAGATHARAVLSSIPPTPLACRLQVIPDYTLIFAYRAVLRLSPECGFSQTLRVRKSSTTSVKRNGAPYQPIRPEVGAWALGHLASTVPGNQNWTSRSWRWEFNDLVLTKGRWIAGEVLYARP
ncbi:hypothetical protein [Deinococcus frigens]|uniref:hypothetical protein n=1 Tax=Deinococcus frigens TaxID=249403 RepID=UPI0004985535|nr:hypothetical protein [Deinococcus frigens]